MNLKRNALMISFFLFALSALIACIHYVPEIFNHHFLLFPMGIKIILLLGALLFASLFTFLMGRKLPDHLLFLWNSFSETAVVEKIFLLAIALIWSCALIFLFYAKFDIQAVYSMPVELKIKLSPVDGLLNPSAAIVEIALNQNDPIPFSSLSLEGNTWQVNDNHLVGFQDNDESVALSYSGGQIIDHPYLLVYSKPNTADLLLTINGKTSRQYLFQREEGNRKIPILSRDIGEKPLGQMIWNGLALVTLHGVTLVMAFLLLIFVNAKMTNKVIITKERVELYGSQKTRQRETLWLVAVVILSLIVMQLRTPLYHLFQNNQHAYYPHGLKFAGVDFLQNDPYANQASTHTAFQYLIVVPSYKLGIMDFTSIAIDIILRVFYSIGIYLLAKELLHYLGHLNGHINIFAAVVSIFYFSLPPASMGLAMMPNFGGYLQPSEFSVLFPFAVSMFMKKKHPEALITLSVISIFHAAYMLYVIPIVFYLIVINVRATQFPTKRIFYFGVGVLFLFLIIIGPVNFAIFNPASGQDILNYIRSPHHYDIHYWITYDRTPLTITGLLTFLAFIFYKKGSKEFSGVYLVLLALVIIGMEIAWIFSLREILSITPWRAASLLFPIGFICLFTIFIDELIRLTPQKFIILSKVILLTLIIGLNFLIFTKNGLLEKPLSFSPISPNEAVLQRNPILLDVMNSSSVNDIILVPPIEVTSIRLLISRPIYVDWKSSFYDSNEFYRRVIVTYDFIQSAYDDRLQYCMKEDFDLYFIPTPGDVGNNEIIYPEADYILGTCP